MSAKIYTLTEEEFKGLLAAAQPQPAIMLQCGPIRTPRENVMDEWRKLGKKYGFDWETAAPAGDGNPRNFVAEEIE